MNRSQLSDNAPDPEQLEYDRALAEYEAAVRAIEDAHESVTVEQIKAAIKTRDQLHQIISTEYPGYGQSLVQILTAGLGLLRDLLQQVWKFFLLLLQLVLATLSGQSRQIRRKLNDVRELDNSLKMRSRLIRRVVEDQRVVPLTSLHEVLDNPKPQWLKLFKSSKPWHDRYDWLWRGISLVCFIWAIALLVDTVNRFLTGGVSTGGVAAILGTVFLTLLSSGGALTSFGQGELERVFESFEIPKKWWDEWRCLLSVTTLSLLIVLRIYGLPFASTCYARTPQTTWFFDLRHCLGETPALTQAAVDNQKVKVQESRYQRSIALNPDNVEPYLSLANLYEQEMDYDNALKTYQMASGIGVNQKKQQAEIGVIRMLLAKEDFNSASERLKENLKKADDLLEDKLKPDPTKPKPRYKVTEDEYQVVKNLGLAYLESEDSSLAENLQRFFKDGRSEVEDFDPLIESKAISNASYWFDQGLNRTESFSKKYEMQTYLGWAAWKQKNFSDAWQSFRTLTRLEQRENIPASPLKICLEGLTLAELAKDSRTANSKTEAIKSALEKCTVADSSEEQTDTVLRLKRLAEVNLQKLRVPKI